MTIICSLAVDVGIFYTAKCEISRAADAAALAAAGALSDGGTSDAAAAQANQFAQANPICGKSIQLNAISFDIGTWASGTFTPDPTHPEAVRVRLQCSQECGNAISLYFGKIIGVNNVDVHAQSIAKCRPKTPDFNLVGINNASFASIGVLAQIRGRFVGNGDVSVGQPLGLLVSVVGDARSYGGSVRKGFLAAITGSQAPLDDKLVYPSAQLPLTNNNDLIAPYIDSNGDFNAVLAACIPAGTYVVRDLNLLAGLSINLQGPVTFYVTRNFNLAASVNLLGSGTFSAENFKVRVLSGGGVFFLAPILAPLNLDLYAPDSDIAVAVGLNQMQGRIIGKTLTFALPLPGTITEERNLSDPFADQPPATIVQ